MIAYCPSCHQPFGSDAEACCHRQWMSGISTVGTLASTASSLMSLYDHLASSQAGPQLLAELGHVLGENPLGHLDLLQQVDPPLLEQLGDYFGDGLGDLLSGFFGG